MPTVEWHPLDLIRPALPHRHGMIAPGSLGAPQCQDRTANPRARLAISAVMGHIDAQPRPVMFARGANHGGLPKAPQALRHGFRRNRLRLPGPTLERVAHVE